MIKENKVYYIYMFREKESKKIIYIGSSSRPMERIKEHIQCAEGRKKNNNQRIYKYLKDNNLEIIKDVEIVWVERVDERDLALRLETEYFFKYKDTILNDRPAEDKNGGYNPKRKKVMCLNDNKVFDSISECARYYGKGRTTINNVIGDRENKTYTYVNGEKYYFKYVN